MCGLIAMFKTKNEISDEVKDFVINQYEEQHSRGTKGFGVININKNLKVEIKRACEPTKFMLDLFMSKSNMLVVHHRTPTSTDNTLDQTHPIKVSNDMLDYDYLVVHNGIISNDDELKKAHEELGFQYTTEYSLQHSSVYSQNKFNDSEALAVELALKIEKKGDKDRKVRGSAAFIAIQINKKTGTTNRVFFGRNTSPLNMLKDKHTIRLSSEGEGDAIEVDKIYSFTPKLNTPIKLKVKSFDWLESYTYTPTYNSNTNYGYYGNNGYNFNPDNKKTEQGKIGFQSSIEENIHDDEPEEAAIKEIENLKDEVIEQIDEMLITYDSPITAEEIQATADNIQPILQQIADKANSLLDKGIVDRNNRTIEQMENDFASRLGRKDDYDASGYYD